MFESLFHLSDTAIFVFIIIAFVVPSLIGIYFIKKYLHVHLRYRDNAVIGNISALIGIIYGVLAGLMALYLINNVSYTNDALIRESNAAANIFRDSKWLKDPVRTDIQKNLMSYLHTVVDIEWPLMQDGNDLNHDGNFIIDNITNDLIHYESKGESDSLLVHDMLDEIKNLYNARQQRINMSNSELNLEIWIVILIGTVLTISINYFFKMGRTLHFVAISAASLMAASMIFLLLTLDRPFQGEFGVQPTSFLTLIDFIQKTNVEAKSRTSTYLPKKID